MRNIRNAKTGKINLGSLKAACRECWYAMDLDTITALYDSIPAIDRYHREFMEFYVQSIREGHEKQRS